MAIIVKINDLINHYLPGRPGKSFHKAMKQVKKAITKLMDINRP